MPILNYTTTISIEKTIAEIQIKLARAGAQAILSEYNEDGIISALSFRIKTSQGFLSFRLPSKQDGVYRNLVDNPKIRPGLKTHEQAARVAWRIVKDWLEAQLAIIEADMADIKEVFLPYAQNQAGKTLYETLCENEFNLLTE